MCQNMFAYLYVWKWLKIQDVKYCLDQEEGWIISESKIDEMEWIQDGRFVLIMEKGGSIYIMNGESGQIVFSFVSILHPFAKGKNNNVYRK